MASALPSIRKGKTGARAVGVAKAVPPRPREREVHAEISGTFCLWGYDFVSRVRNGWVRDTTSEALTAELVRDGATTEGAVYRTRLGRSFHYLTVGHTAGPWALAESPLHFAIAEVVYDRVVVDGKIDDGALNDLKRCGESDRRGEREAIFARAVDLLQRDALTDHPGLRGWQLQTGGTGGAQRWKKNAGDPRKKRTVQAWVWWAGRNGWRWKVARGSQTATATKYGRLSTFRTLAEGASLTRSEALELCEEAVGTWADRVDDYATHMKAKAKAANLCSQCGKWKADYAHNQAAWVRDMTAAGVDGAISAPRAPAFHTFAPYPGAEPDDETPACTACGREGTARANDNPDVCDDETACAECVLEAEADAVRAAELTDEGDDDEA